MGTSANLPHRSSIVSDVFDAVRRHPGLSFLSFICCIPFVVFAPGLPDRTRFGLGGGGLVAMLTVGAAAALRGAMGA